MFIMMLLQVVSAKRWVLTSEGEGVRREGSHEARLWALVDPAGLPQKDLMAKCGDLGRVGFSKAMSNGWIMLDKTDGGKVKRKVCLVISKHSFFIFSFRLIPSQTWSRTI